MAMVSVLELQKSYKLCADICRNHYENFPVASRLVPEKLRPHIYAIYAFARTADDFADEPGMSPQERLARLEEWEECLKVRSQESGVRSQNNGREGIFLALHDTIQKFSLPLSLFADLLKAFKMDVTKARYQTWDDVLYYCWHSANPVGRLVLALFGERGEEKGKMSDAICTALQLANFWQDLDIDFKRGRIYLPKEDMDRFGVTEEDLARGKITPAYCKLMEFETHKTEVMFMTGRQLCDSVSPGFGRELRLIWLGGMRILERLNDVKFDVFSARPTLGLKDKLLIAARALSW